MTSSFAARRRRQSDFWLQLRRRQDRRRSFFAAFFTALRFAVVVVCLAPFLKLVPGRLWKIVKASLCIGVVHFGLMFVGMSLSSGSASIAILAQLHVSFVVASALAIGFGVVLIPGTRGIPIATLQAWMAVISLPPLLLLSGLFEHGQTAAIATAGLREWGVLAFVAIGATILGHGSWYFLLKRYSVTLIAAFTLLGPVFGVMSGGLFLGDRLTYEIVGGGVLVLFGIGMIQVWSVQKHEVTELGRGV